MTKLFVFAHDIIVLLYDDDDDDLYFNFLQVICILINCNLLLEGW